MSTEQIIRTTCGICLGGCSVLVHLANGKPVKIEGDPDGPVNHGVLCAKGLASLEYLHHPDRLKHPLRRTGERGDGKWQQISWDEALNTIAEELTKAKDNHGAESVLFMRGGTRGIISDYLTRFANAFGTPNISSMASVCYVPQGYAVRITHGWPQHPFPDYEYPPACIVVWGSNSAETSIGWHQKIIRALDRGSRLIVIDPANIELASRADLWLKPRPGSDLALALGMINVIVNEELFDKAFVDNWTVGFDELKAHVQDYPPEKVEDITWVSAEAIREVARFYATNKPACIQWGNGLEHNVNSFQTARAISIMRAITGNLGVPGGELQLSPLPLLDRSSPEFSLLKEIPADKRANRISAKDKLLPIAFYALPQSIVKAIIEEDPYPIRVVYVMAGNPLLSYSNIQETRRALKKLDFLVVADMFMTPTACLADIVLPVTTYLEYDSIRESVDYLIFQIQQKVAEVGECRSDYQILSGLAKKLGLGRYFWDTEEQCLDSILKPAGLTFDEFRQVRAIFGSKRYRVHEANGFETPSGKVELYSSQLEQWGFDPLPVYYELPETPYSDPELAKEYPLIFTSTKVEPYRHSEGRQISLLRTSHPEPITTIHSETASKLGIKEGDWVYIETKRGRIRQKATLSDSIDPRVVVVDYDWWFPEKGKTNLYGCEESNINILTDNKLPYSREVGAANLRGILCKVYKASE